MQFEIRKRGQGERWIAQPEFTQLEDNKLIGSAKWSDGDETYESYEVVTVRDRKIIDMQSCKSRREAERFARRH